MIIAHPRPLLHAVVQIHSRLLHRTGTWGKTAAELRGLGNDPLSIGMETLNCCLVPAYYLPALIHSYKQLEKKSMDELKELRTTADGSKIVKVWPVAPSDMRTCAIVAPDVEAMVYIQPGKAASRGTVYGPTSKGGVVAVLGAGNHGFLGLKDILYCLFEKNQGEKQRVLWQDLSFMSPVSSRSPNLQAPPVSKRVAQAV